MSGWKETVAAAQKALGKEGKLPKPRVDPATLQPLWIKAMDGFNASREDLEKKLLDFENVLTQTKNTLQQYIDMVDGNNFGLDEDDPEKKKSIEAARGLLLGWLNDTQSKCDKNIETMSKLDRVVTDLRRLKDMKP